MAALAVRAFARLWPFLSQDGHSHCGHLTIGLLQCVLNRTALEDHPEDQYPILCFVNDCFMLRIYALIRIIELEGFLEVY